MSVVDRCRRAARRLPAPVRTRLARLAGHPPVRRALRPIRWGNVRRTTPFSRRYGFDRGTPIDRIYLDEFFSSHADDIRGRVLEVDAPVFTRRHGTQSLITSVDVVDIDGRNDGATIVADLADAGSLPVAAFDCIVLPQTLQYVADPLAAVTNLWAALAPGGVLLVTVPSLAKVDHHAREVDAWRWVPHGLATLLTDGCPGASIDVVGFGNALSGAAFLMGASSEDLGRHARGAAPTRLPRDRRGTRAEAGAIVSARHAQRGLVLLYHRVHDPADDPLGLAVAPGHFADHLAVLADEADIVPLDRIFDPTPRGRRVAVTFDDGYADNVETAAPILVDAGVPATFFVVTSDPAIEFWWDRLDHLLGAPEPAVDRLDVVIAGRRLRADVRTDCGAGTARRALNHRIAGPAPRRHRSGAGTAWPGSWESPPSPVPATDAPSHARAPPARGRPRAHRRFAHPAAPDARADSRRRSRSASSPTPRSDLDGRRIRPVGRRSRIRTGWTVRGIAGPRHRPRRGIPDGVHERRRRRPPSHPSLPRAPLSGVGLHRRRSARSDARAGSRAHDERRAISRARAGSAGRRRARRRRSR